MKRSEVNRDPMKARKRAKNDASTATRKLAEWAREIGRADMARELETMRERIAEISDKLSEKSEKDSKAA